MGCFPCFGSSGKEVKNSSNGVKEVSKKESFKEGSAAQSISHVNRGSSGNIPLAFPIFLLFFILILVRFMCS